MSERASLSTHHRELMLSLAYLGGLTYALALRLLPCYSERTLQRDLADLRQLGDVEKHPIYKPGPKGRPVKQYDVWTLTDKGHGYIAAKANDQYPTKPAKLRHKRVMAHDLLVVKTIVVLVEHARREGLSGLFVHFELRLNPAERRPIPDAVVIMQFGGGFGQPNIVPWTKDPAIEDETRSRFVIEADSQTETLSVIAGKARAYQAAFQNAEWRDWWEAQFGPQPIIIWVVADKEDDPRPAGLRLSSIYGAWSEVWPGGYWLGTTEQLMEQQHWAVYAPNGCGWFKLTTLQTERKHIRAAQPTPLAARPLAPAADPTPATSPAPIVARGYTHGPDADTPSMSPTGPSASQRAPHVAATDMAVPGAASRHDLRSASSPPAHPAAGDRWTGGAMSAYYYYPPTSAPVRPVYVPPAPARPEPEYGSNTIAERMWEALCNMRFFLRETRYFLRDCLEVFGILWFVRTTARLIMWFFFEEGYRVVLPLVVIAVCLGVIGWGGHRLYVIYRANPLFSFDRQAPTPTGLVVIAPTAAAPPQPAEPEPLPAQPTPPATCGVARVVSEGLNLRGTPGGQVVKILVRDDELILLCDVQLRGTTEWVHVRSEEQVGWVSGRYLSSAGPGS